MKKAFFICILALLAIGVTGAQNFTISGLLDTTVSLQAGAGDAPKFSFGFEEFVNIRLQWKIKERAVVVGAVNLIAAAGEYAANAAMAAAAATDSPLINMTAFVGGENFIAAIELERLYFRLNWEMVAFDGGLMRLPFGYGQVWGPSDFLNPKNPLKPDARARAVLGAALFLYPIDSLKLLTFFSMPRNPFLQDGSGILAGLSVDHHWDIASVQALYSFQAPIEGAKNGIHRAGLSVKADVEVGLFMDALYTYNHEEKTGIDGLSLSAGADYSFLDGDLFALAEYLYNGKKSSTALGYNGSFANNHYLYTSLTWRINFFSSISAALISCFDDISFTPIISFSQELFQGVVLTVTAQVPMDRDLYNKNGRRGELGPLPPDNMQPLLYETGERLGRYFNFTAKLRLRF